MRTLLAYLEMLRAGNALTVATNVTAGLAVAALVTGHTPDAGHAGMAVLATVLLYLAGMAMNAAVDARVDAEERPERPIPSGRVRLRGAWIAFALLAVAGVSASGGTTLPPIPVVVAFTIGILLLQTRPLCVMPAFRMLGWGWLLAGAVGTAWMVAGRVGDLRVETALAILLCAVLYNLSPRGGMRGALWIGACRALAVLMGMAAGMPTALPQPSVRLIVALGAAPLAMAAYTVALSRVARHEVARHEAATSAHPPHRGLALFAPIMAVAALVPIALWRESVRADRTALIGCGVLLVLAVGPLWLALRRADRAAAAHPTRVPGAVAAWIAAMSLADAATCAAAFQAGPAVACLAMYPLTRLMQRRMPGS